MWALFINLFDLSKFYQDNTYRTCMINIQYPLISGLLQNAQSRYYLISVALELDNWVLIFSNIKYYNIKILLPIVAINEEVSLKYFDRLQYLISPSHDISLAPLSHKTKEDKGEFHLKTRQSQQTWSIRTWQLSLEGGQLS